jgi:cytochrome c-type biogenesis protein CcmH/NrfG
MRTFEGLRISVGDEAAAVRRWLRHVHAALTTDRAEASGQRSGAEAAQIVAARRLHPQPPRPRHELGRRYQDTGCTVGGTALVLTVFGSYLLLGTASAAYEPYMFPG